MQVSAAREDSRAIIEVIDNGRGMSEEDVESLFDIDFVSGSRVRARFGLAACRSIVHGHGGDIVVQSRLGEGTVVRIRLPIQVGEPGASS